MRHPNFANQLAEWHNLRTWANQVPLEEALLKINRWWFSKPWIQYSLHWDDIQTWPDPWQLLSDNSYCELARGLGILYTISMIEHKDLQSAQLVLTDQDYNLVKINQEIYTLNWDQDSIVNTDLSNKVKKRFTLEQVNRLYK